MTEKERYEIYQLIEIADTQGDGKLVIIWTNDGKIKYCITKNGEI
jgi:hypothetical protein